MLHSLLDPHARQHDLDVKLTLGLLRLTQTLNAALGTTAHDAGVSPLQLQILVDLRDQAGGDRVPGHFANRYGVAASTITDSVAALVRKRLVRLHSDKGDRRRRELTLAPAGRRLSARALQRLDVLVSQVRQLSLVQRQQGLALTVQLIAIAAPQGWVDTDRVCPTCRFFTPASRGKPTPYCKLMERPLPPADLRIDCPEHSAPSPR